MAKMTPKEIFEAAKVLDPSLKRIAVDEHGLSFFYPRARASDPGETSCGYARSSSVNIDWPNGTTEYPLPEPKWRDAEWPRDTANPPKVCRIRDTPAARWTTAELYGFDGGQWVTGLNRWKFCQVIDNSKPVTESPCDPKPKEIVTDGSSEKPSVPTAADLRMVLDELDDRIGAAEYLSLKLVRITDEEEEERRHEYRKRIKAFEYIRSVVICTMDEIEASGRQSHDNA